MLHWVRARRGFCGHLALFALALQLYLSFGHIHPEELGLSAPAQPTGVVQASDGPASPHDDDDHGICSICAALSLTANSVMPASVALALPVASEWTWSQQLPSVPLVAKFAANFRARAPPVA
jgi:hypothetical protein